MKKKQKSTASPDLDLKSLIHEHSLFFDKLIELIPARFYLPVEDKEKPWFQGLSKTAKASAKKESKENIKKSRRARLDPEKSSTTLELLHKTIKKEKSVETTNEESGKETVIENQPDLKGENRSVTYEELRQRLHRRIEEFRSNRNAGPSSQAKIEMKRDVQQGKRKRDTESKQTKSDSVRTDQNQNPNEEVSEELTFGHVKLGNEDGRNKKRKLSKPQTLEKAKRLEEAKKDPEKGEIVSKKHSWKAAATRAAGIKVHDDPKLLKQSMKKDKKRHQKNAEKWKERTESREKTRAEKQKSRAGNIAERIQQKKMRRIAKREKKLMRPGFEGRKDGFINAA
eukprot:TRINITY_DN2738_c0_g1_i6.p1 TRINITY_DN2738_c0_g1~~TRINITY_DN2738_c0_g1_i6.p1  ORF type:complete len:340 (-),score=81.14 TRINITY_DN2738_c0_g1_i6:252-1271(-)